MKKLLLFLAAVALGLLPTIAFATSAAPWSITNLTDSFIFPNLVNGTPKGILVSASSTINGAFTIATSTSGCATFSPTGLIYSTGVGCGTGSGSSSFGTSSLSALYPIIYTQSSSLAQFSTAFGTTTPWGMGNNGFVITGATGIPFTAASSTLNLPNTALQNSSITINTAGGTTGGGSVSLGGTLNLSSFSYPFPAGATTSALTLGGLTLSNLAGGGTLCVHVNNAGTFSTTLSDCGSSGGTVTTVTATPPIFSSGGTTPNITWAGLATTSQPASSNLLTSNGGAGVYGTATSTLIASGPLTGSFTQVGTGGALGCTTAASGVAGCLSNTSFDTFNNKQAALTAVWPQILSGATLTFGGLSTSSPIAAGAAVLYATGVNTIASAATGTVAAGTGISVTAGQSIIGSGLTITNTGVTSLGNGTGTTCSGTAPGTCNVNTTQNITTLSNLSTAGTLNNTANGLLYSTGTSTPAVTAPITYSGTLGQFIGGVSGNFGCTNASAGVTGCLTGTDWSTFNSKAGFAWPFTPINGTSVSTTSGLVIIASSTIGNGTQGNGLTISGGATTTLNASFLSSVVIGTSTGALSLLNSNAGNLFLYNTNTSGSSPALVMGGNSGGDTDFWFGRTNNNDTASNDSLQIGAGLVPGTTPVMTWTYQGFEGIGSTSPFAKLSIHANPTDPAASPMLFAIGSSTATATTTLFTFDNTGNLNIFDRFGSPTVSVNAASTTGPQLAIFATTTSNAIFNAKVCGVAGGVCLFQIDQYGHFAASSTAPTLSSCGTSPSLSSDSSDANGTITVGSVAATACTLTFGSAHTIGTHCVISEQTGSVVNAASYTESLTGFVYSQTGLTSDKLDYICGGI